MPEINPNQVEGANKKPVSQPTAATAPAAAKTGTSTATAASSKTTTTEKGTETKWHLSPLAIAKLWIGQGGPRSGAELMAGIAVAESGGWMTAENVAGRSTHDLAYAPPYTSYSPTKDYSIGLWQINFYSSLGPARAKQYAAMLSAPYGDAPTKFAQWLRTHPDAQAKIAIHLYAGGNGIGNWQGDAAYAAWRKDGLPGLKPFLGSDYDAIVNLDAAGGGSGGSGKGSGSGSGSGSGGSSTGTGTGSGSTGSGSNPDSSKPGVAPKPIAQPWREMWQDLQAEGNTAHAAGKALRQRLIVAVGGPKG